MKIAYFDAQQTSIWDNVAALQAFAGSLGLGDPSEAGACDVAWWIADRHVPTVAEAEGRLEFLRRHGPSPYAFRPFHPEPELSIERVWLDNADVQLLISQLNSDLYSRYPEPGALVFSLHPDDIVDGVGVLLMAVHDDRPVGCGAFRVVDDQPGSAEIKRMYVSLAGRGKKIGAAVLVELERAARDIGIERFVLETGPRQPEALHRYEQAGYVACVPWGEFIGKDFSICMVKTAARS